MNALFHSTRGYRDLAALALPVGMFFVVALGYGVVVLSGTVLGDQNRSAPQWIGALLIVGTVVVFALALWLGRRVAGTSGDMPVSVLFASSLFYAFAATLPAYMVSWLAGTSQNYDSLAAIIRAAPTLAVIVVLLCAVVWLAIFCVHAVRRKPS
jgi:hypothetical protein